MARQTSVGATLFGQGVAFPPRLNTSGRVAWSSGEDSVRESIRVILMTEPGERLMLPNFGAGLRSFLFEPNVASTHRMIEERIAHALRRWEPRISVVSIQVARHQTEPTLATVTIGYALVATSARESVQLTVAVQNRGGTP